MITIANRLPLCINSQYRGSFDGLYTIEDMVVYLLLFRKNSFLCFASPWPELLEWLNGSPVTFPGMVKQKGAVSVLVLRKTHPSVSRERNDYLYGPL